jgi:hypothetical protein
MELCMSAPGTDVEGLPRTINRRWKGEPTWLWFWHLSTLSFSPTPFFVFQVSAAFQQAWFCYQLGRLSWFSCLCEPCRSSASRSIKSFSISQCALCFVHPLDIQRSAAMVGIKVTDIVFRCYDTVSKARAISESSLDLSMLIAPSRPITTITTPIFVAFQCSQPHLFLNSDDWWLQEVHMLCKCKCDWNQSYTQLHQPPNFPHNYLSYYG